MKNYLVSISIILLCFLAGLALLNACSKQSATILQTVTPSSKISSTIATTDIWQNVKVYYDPNSSITTQVNQLFALEAILYIIPYAQRMQISDPDAFSELDRKDISSISSNVDTTTHLFKALKVGTFQISFFDLGTGGDISQKQTYKIIVNP